jgi:hypothetical protein
MAGHGGSGVGGNLWRERIRMREVTGGEGGSGGPNSVPPGPEWRNRVLGLAAGAILFRLLLFLGRGDYLAFDEGWYLLLARSLFTGDGYSLIGIPHITLSPLFPILAGGVGSLLGNWVWGGRVVAALASGLLVLPAWAIFRRLAPPRTAFATVILVAVLPSMAPFVVPFLIGADLWVGAEPLLHLFLFSGVALWLRADEKEDRLSWLLSGGAFALAFLARPEAIITWGLLGLAALGLAGIKRSPRRFFGALAMGIGFLLVASPYWVYLHDVTGEWGLTGRGINPAANVAKMVSGGQRGGATSTIEDMLWFDDDAYVQRLYGLDESGLRLGSDYWGVYPEEVSAAPGESPSAEIGQGLLPEPIPVEEEGAAPGAEPDTGAAGDSSGSQIPSFPALFARSMRTILSPLLWLFVLLGALAPRGPRVAKREIFVASSLLGTSLAIATLVAVDPRTQLFLVPLLAFYVARGFAFLDDLLKPRVKELTTRHRFLEGLLVAITVIWLLSISVNRLYLGLSFGSPHHIVARQNRQVAEELGPVFGLKDGPVASWHPGIAVYADRDWRVLPFTDLDGIIRYAGASGAEVAVISAYYPPFQGEEILGTRYLILPIPPGVPELREWMVLPVEGDTIRGVGRLEERSQP